MRSRLRKRYLVHNNTAYPLTHDIRKLLELCERIDNRLAAALIHTVGLTQFAVRFRYPGEDQPTRQEALPWLDLARLVYLEVTRRLTESKTPGTATPIPPA